MEKKAKRKNKKAVSTVIVTVLLIVLGMAIAALIFRFALNTLQNAQNEGANSASKAECLDKFQIQFQGCFDIDKNEIYLDIINNKEPLPENSLISLESDTTRILMPFGPTTSLTSGDSISMTLSPSVTLSNFNLKKIKIVPVYNSKGTQVLCNELDTIAISECTTTPAP